MRSPWLTATSDRPGWAAAQARTKPARPGRDPGGPAYGIALLSRLGQRSVTPVALPRPEGPGEPRVALIARIDLDGGPLTVGATHLSFLPRSGIAQLRWLERRLGAE